MGKILARNWIKLGLKRMLVELDVGFLKTRNWIKLGLKPGLPVGNSRKCSARNWIKLGLKLSRARALASAKLASQLD